MGPVPWNFVALIFVTGHCFIESLQQWSGALRDAIDSVLGFGGGITYLGVRECDGTVLVRPENLHLHVLHMPPASPRGVTRERLP